jgi:hypothetical protein
MSPATSILATRTCPAAPALASSLQLTAAKSEIKTILKVFNAVTDAFRKGKES